MCAPASDAAERITDGLIEALPDLRALLMTDVRAAFEGDPAATGADEVVFSYPGHRRHLRLPHRAQAVSARRGHRAAHDDRAGALRDRHRHPPGGDHRRRLLHRSRHRRRHRRDHDHRQPRAHLPGRDARRAVAADGKGAPARDGQAPPDHRGRRHHLRQRHHPRRRDGHRPRRRHRRQQLDHRERAGARAHVELVG